MKRKKRPFLWLPATVRAWRAAAREVGVVLGSGLTPAKKAAIRCGLGLLCDTREVSVERGELLANRFALRLPRRVR